MLLLLQHSGAYAMKAHRKGLRSRSSGLRTAVHPQQNHSGSVLSSVRSDQNSTLDVAKGPQPPPGLINFAANPVLPMMGEPQAPLTPKGLQNPQIKVQPAGENPITIPPIGSARRPQIFFLFLVYSKINNEEVWERFFAPAVQGVDFRAFVHCKDEATCRQNIRAKYRFEIISSVATQYCFDLVSGMNALLTAALESGGEGTVYDKFVLVSDSTIPVKPFRHVHHRLTVEAGTNSDFCVFPRNEWAEVTETYLQNGKVQAPLTRVAVKHHQWIVLSREHAKLSVQRSPHLRNLMQTFQLNMGFKNTGCLDEFWHFATVFSSFNLTHSATTFYLQGFNGGPLVTGNYEIQGQCNTFVHWLPRASGLSNNITRTAKEIEGDPGTDIMPPTEKRPASIRRLSKASLTTLRNSWFLFARKVDDDCAFSGCESLAEAFDSVVFSSPPRPLAKSTATWRGHGTWLDNRGYPVSINSNEGSMKLTGAGDSMQAKGSYCGDWVDVIFVNGYRAMAILSADGLQLRWSNGVVWTKSIGAV